MHFSFHMFQPPHLYFNTLITYAEEYALEVLRYTTVSCASQQVSQSHTAGVLGRTLSH
jgi:hypothetical protein